MDSNISKFDIEWQQKQLQLLDEEFGDILIEHDEDDEEDQQSLNTISDSDSSNDLDPIEQSVNIQKIQQLMNKNKLTIRNKSPEISQNENIFKLSKSYLEIAEQLPSNSCSAFTSPQKQIIITEKSSVHSSDSSSPQNKINVSYQRLCSESPH
eukprot:141145_1